MQARRVLLCILGVAMCAALPHVAEASGKVHAKHTEHGKHSAAVAKQKTSTKAGRKHPSVVAHVVQPAAPIAKNVVKTTVVRAALAKPAVHRVKKGPDDEADLDSAGGPMIKSSAFYVQDVASGEVLLQKNSAAVQPIASITKLMTTMVVLDVHQNLNEVLEVTDEDVDRLKGSSSHLTVGSKLTREELIHLALMASENRAASALARNYPGGMPAFLEAMNAKARLLGLMETHFFDGTGLTKNNVSSARDLAILVSTASRYPLIREFSTSTEYTATLAGGRNYTFHNTNALVKSPEWQIDVSKTGYINESGKCLVMQAWFGNKQLAIVLLDSWGRFTRIADANRIRKWLEASAGKHSVAAAGQHLKIAGL
jgi:serine-type D-Ala-D-Ala endopeptidase (penicillin-binding protein 7)